MSTEENNLILKDFLIAIVHGDTQGLLALVAKESGSSRAGTGRWPAPTAVMGA